MRRLTVNAVVTLLVAYALASLYTAASQIWQPFGTIGLSADYDANVRAVSPGGAAALAGIVAGDHVELATTPVSERRFVAGVSIPNRIGRVVHFRLTHHGIARDIRLTAIPSIMTAADRSSLLLQCFCSLIFIAVGSSLILLRPSLATWGFGLYCMILLPTSANFIWVPSSDTALAEIFLYDVAQSIAVAGLALFALEFPRPFNTTWRKWIRRSLPVLCVGLAVMLLYPDVANLLLGTGAEAENRILQLVIGAMFALAMSILYDTYRRIGVDGRERMRWVLIGCSVGVVTNYIGNTLLFSSMIPIDPPVWFVNLLVSLNVLLPVTVAHAVVRHRVLHIDFVIGRALVYATATTSLAAIFALLDWAFGNVLEDFRLSRLVEAGVSIGIAFAFNTFQKRIEGFIQAIFFRKRRAAEARLARLALELPRARAVGAIEKAMVEEVIDALELTSAALFRPRGNRLSRAASYGWHDADCGSLDDSDLLVLSLRSEKRSIKLAELPWRHADLPSGSVAPVVAIPMDSRGELAGVMLYGGHSGGADVDPTELAQLERLAHAGAVALDELDAERLRKESVLQTQIIGQLRARLDELRRLQPFQSGGAASPHPLEAGSTFPLP